MMTQNTWKQILAGICGLAGTVVLAQNPPTGTPVAPANAEEAVAKVNGKTITRRQLGEAVANDLRVLAQRGTQLGAAEQLGYERQVLGRLINDELLMQAASKTTVPDADQKVEDRIARFKASFPDPKTFEEQLRVMGQSMEQVRAKIRHDLVLQAFVEAEFASKIKVTDAQIEGFYKENPRFFQKPAQIRASHILVSVAPDAADELKKTKRATIDKARERVTTGKEDFGKVAGEVSDCPSKGRGGDLEFFGRGQMVPEFDKAAFELKEGEISGVVTTQFGYHIIKRTGEQSATTLALDAAREGIERFLKSREVEKQLTQYIEAQRKTASIETLLK